MRMPKIVKCASPACNGVARTKGLCLSCANRKRRKVHATNCPALSAWDIPGACNCSGLTAFPVDAPEVPNG